MKVVKIKIEIKINKNILVVPGHPFAIVQRGRHRYCLAPIEIFSIRQLALLGRYAGRGPLLGGHVKGVPGRFVASSSKYVDLGAHSRSTATKSIFFNLRDHLPCARDFAQLLDR